MKKKSDKLIIANKALKQSEELLQKNLQEISENKYSLDESTIIAITDEKGIINKVNSNFCKITKYSEEELIGQDHRIINSGYHTKVFIRDLWVTIDNGKIWKGELKNKAKDGNFYWVYTTIVPFLNGEGKPYQYLAIMADITDRKQAEDNLIQRTAQLVIANKELAFQNEEKENRASELVIANKELVFQNEEKEKRAAELIIANKLASQNEEIEKRSEELILVNKELKKTEQAIKESEEKYRSLIEQASDAIFINNAEGKLLDVNESACTMLGYTKEQLCTMKLSDLFTADELSQKPIMQKELLRGERTSVERNILRSNGSLIPVDITAKMLSDGRTMAIVRDISERRKAEQAIKESEEKYRTLVEQASDAIFITDTAGRFITVNASACKLSQYSEKELLKKTIYDLAVTEDLQKNPFHFDELKQGKTVINERVINRNNGILLNVEVTSKLLSDGRLQVFVRDISERKKAQNEIIKEKNLSDSIINSLPGIFYLYNMEGKFLRWNKNLETESKYSAEEIREMHPLDFFDEDEKELLSRKIKNVFISGKETVQANFLLKTKEKIPYYFTGTAISYEGSPCLMGVGIDFSELKKTQQALAENENHLRVILQTSPECIKLTGINGELEEMNPAGLAMIEADSFEQIKGKSLFDVIDKPYRKAFSQLTQNVFKGKSEKLEFEITGLKGTHRWMETHAVPLKDAEGKVISLLGTTRDITERKFAEEEMNKITLQLNEVSSSIPGTVYQFMLKPDGSFSFPFVSEGMTELSGLSLEEIYRDVNVVFAKIHPNDLPAVIQTIQDSAAHFTPWLHIFRVKQPNTKPKWIRGNSIPGKLPDGSVLWNGTMIDITDIKEAEENLNQSESRLKEAQTIAHLGSWELNFATNVALWSDEACRIYGLSPKENKQTYANWVSFIHPEDLDYVMTANNESQKTLSDTVLNHRIILKDGTIKHIYSVAKFKFDQNGKPVGLYGIAHDVTKRKEVEIDLKASEERFRTLIQNNTDAIMVLNKNGKVIFSSDSLYRIMGYNADEIIGVNTFNFIYSEDLPALKKHFKKVLKNPEKSMDITYRRVKKDGTIIWCEGTALNLLHDPAIQGIVINFRNITERKEAEEQIRQSETHLTEAQRLAKMGSWNYDIKADKLTWSEELYNVFDTDKQTFIETHGSFLRLIDEKDREFALQTSRLTQKTGEPFTIEYHITTSKGEKRVILEHGYGQKDDNGKIIRLFGTAQDITEQVLSQIEKEKITADIVQRNKDLEQFSYIVSHNLRAPVANILGFSAIAQDENLEPDMKKEVMDGLSHSVKRLDDVIIDLNNILQTRQGLSQNKEMVHFSKIANNIHTSIENLIKKEKAVLVWDFSEVDEMITIKSYLHSIFYNLIFNSLKYRQPGIPPVIVIKSRKLKDKIELLFKDNGMGIDLEKVGDQVFGLYKRFHTKSSEGKGMGLYMVKTQVETLGGKISISSEVNKGTDFIIEFEI